MLGIDRRAAGVAWTVLLVLAAISLIPVLWHTLVVFVIAILFAYLLSPLVELINRLLPAQRSRTAALAIVYLLLVGLLVVLAITVRSRVANEAAALAGKIPDLMASLGKPEEFRLPQPLRDMIPAIRDQIQAHSKDLLSVLPKTGARLLSAASNAVYVVIVPVLAFFFLKDGRRLLAAVLDLLSDFIQRPVLEEILSDVHVLLGQYMRALVILALATLLFYGLFFAIVGVPYSLLLAAIAAPLEFVPVVGPLVAAITIVLVTALSGSPHLLIVLIFLGAYRMFQDYILQPHLMSAGTELHPLAVLFGVLAGGQVAGVTGSFLSVPVMATLRIVYRRLRRSRREMEPASTQ